MTKTDYKVVTTLEEIQDYLRDFREVAFDYETAPDEPYRKEEKAALDPAKSHIVTMSLSVKEGTGIMIPVAHRIGKNMEQDTFSQFLQAFLTSKDIIKITHNLQFEAMFSYARGIVMQEPVYDTIAASQMSQKSATQFRTLGESGLKRLAEELCGEPLPSFSTVTGGKHFDELDPNDPETIRYSCADSDFALRLYHRFNAWFDRFLPRHRWIVEHLESPTAVYLGIMKYNGVPIDEELMLKRKAEAEAEMERIREEIRFLIGDVNIGSNCSTNAFRKYLYEDLRLPVMKVTESMREALDDATMVLLKEWCDQNRPDMAKLFTLVQEYRKWGKIKSTYIDGYLKYQNPVTGRLHPNFYSLSTDTGRFNCAQPNCQNMPRKTNDPIGVRNFIQAPEDEVLVSCDYSQIELRVGAYYCQDPFMLDTYRKGGDIHAATTAVIFNIPYEQALDKHAENYKERRTIAKNVNFGTFYGLFPGGLQRTLRFKAGIVKHMDECEEIISHLKAGYPKLKVWQEETKRQAARRKYTETRLGRRRYLPNIDSKDWGKKSFAERCSMNTPIQGTAADIIKLSLGRVIVGLPERPWLKPILQIHDELTFLVPEEKLPEAIAFIKACMEPQPFASFDLPLVAEAAAGPTFGKMEEWEEVADVSKQ
ncbi:MAG: bifunctional 3'-5' exonuclease/DNA polymerase [Clostridium sp.]|nr:bifunctional 3'-5' exonuclease/DNA polymerase [Clostridium sp.]